MPPQHYMKSFSWCRGTQIRKERHLFLMLPLALSKSAFMAKRASLVASLNSRSLSLIRPSSRSKVSENFEAWNADAISITSAPCCIRHVVLALRPLLKGGIYDYGTIHGFVPLQPFPFSQIFWTFLPKVDICIKDIQSNSAVILVSSSKSGW